MKSTIQSFPSLLPKWLAGEELPAAQETPVRLPGLEEPLEEVAVTLCSTLAWRSPRDRAAWRAAEAGRTGRPVRLHQQARRHPGSSQLLCPHSQHQPNQTARTTPLGCH